VFNALGANVSKLAFFALDIETTGYNGEPGQHPTQAMIDGIRTYNVCPIIYSGWGMWGDMGVQGNWSQVKLWDTSGWLRTGQSEEATVFEFTQPFTQFGGFTAASRVMEQLTFDTPVTANGITVNVDLDVLDAAWLTSVQSARGTC
jgi:hypothetical protein